MKCHPLRSHLPTELRCKPAADLHTIHIFQFIEEGPCCFSRQTNLQKQNKYWRGSAAAEPRSTDVQHCQLFHQIRSIQT